MAQALIATVGFLCGAILHAAVLRLVARRRERRLNEALLAGLALALVIWNGANCVRAFAVLLTGRPPPAPLEGALDALAVPALALVPSLILHTLAALRARGGAPSRRWLLVYAPLPA